MITLTKDNSIFQPRDAWDKLSMEEQAAMMKVAVKNGIFDLATIKQKYNEFAEGGNVYDGESEDTQRMTVQRTPHVDLAVSNPWLYNKLHPSKKKEEPYEPTTFAGRVAQVAGAGELGQKYVDYSSSAIQQIPGIGLVPSALDLGYDVNRMYHNPSTTTAKDVALDAASLLPALRKTLKGWWMKGNSGSFITETGQVINNPRVASSLEVMLQPYRTAVNTGIYVGRAADFLDDSKAYLKDMYNDSPIGKHFPIKALGGPIVEAAMNEYKSGGGNLFSGEEEGSQQMSIGLNVPKVGLDVQGWPNYTTEQIIANGERVQQQRQAEANKSFLEKLQDILDTKVQVQATPGTATGYATTGQYMPKSESTVGRQLIEGTATVASPFIPSAALSLSPGSVFWMNPITQQITKSTLGGIAADTISTVATGNTIGKNVRKTIGWQPNNEWVKLGYELLTDMANPGYMFGTKRPGFDIVPSPIVPSKGSAQMNPGRNFGTFRPETFNNWGSESLTHLTKDYAVKVPKQSRTPIDVGPKTFDDLGWRYRAAVNEKLAANKIAGFEPYEYIGYHTTENGYTPVFRQKRLTLMGENTPEGKIFNEEALSDIEREMSTHSGLWKSWNIGDYGPAHNIGKNAEGVGRLYDATYSREPITWIMQNFPRKWEISLIGNARLFGNTLERSANE